MNTKNESELARWARKLGCTNEYLIAVWTDKLRHAPKGSKREQQLKRSIKFAERWEYERHQPGIAMVTCWDDDNPLERSGIKELKLDGTDTKEAFDAGDNNV